MRELRRYRSCDGLEFDTMADAAKHECKTAIPQKLLSRLTKMHAAEYGALKPSDMPLIEALVTVMTLDRRNARIIRDTLDEFSKASIHLPLEVV
jgi:hypothetical protein